MKRFVVVLLLTVAFSANTSNGVSRPTYPLCEETKFRKECSEKVLPKGSCFIERWGSGQECEDLRLNETSPKIHSQNLVGVKLGVYQYLHNHRSYPNPTISFSKINCTDVLVKLTVVGGNASSCIKFSFPSSNYKLMETADFLYDCRWLSFQYKFIEFPMTIEYQASDVITATTEYKKYYFSLPKNGSVDQEETGFHDFQLLVYREDEEGSLCATFHWSKPPVKFEVSKFRVTLHNMKDNVTKPDSVYIEGTKKSFCSLPETGTSYFISVEPCTGSESNLICGSASVSSPFFTNASNTHMIIVLLVALFILIIILLLLWCWYFIKLYASRRNTRFKNCVLVFEPSCRNHIIVLTKLVKFLRSLRVPVLFGESDIQNENSTDWYSRELSRADLILIVSNPTPNSSLDVVTASTYYPVYARGYVENFLRDIINKKNKKFIRIVLPYCNENNFYEFTRTKKCYHLIKEPHRLLQEILGPFVWIPQFLSWALFAPYFQTDEWAQLKKAVEDFPHVSEVEVTAPLNANYEVEYHQSCNTLSSSISEDEGGAYDVELRNQKLLKRKDEECSGSESEFQPDLVAVSQTSIDVAIDDMVDAHLQL